MEREISERVHHLQANRDRILLKRPANEITYRRLGKGPRVETIGLNKYDIVSLCHPIKAEDFRHTTGFSCEELHEIYDFLQHKIAYVNRNLELIAKEDADVYSARSQSFVELSLHLLIAIQMPGSFDPTLNEAAFEAIYGSKSVNGTKPRARRVCIGNETGHDIDDVFLPDHGGDYRIFHPLLPENIRVVFGDLELEVQILAVLQIIMALQRRSFARMLCAGANASPFLLSSSRMVSIESLWDVYQELSRTIAEEEVVRHIEGKFDALTNGGRCSHEQAAAEDFYMLPRSKDLGFCLESAKFSIVRPASRQSGGTSTFINHQSLDGSVRSLQSRVPSSLEAFPAYSEESQLQSADVGWPEDALDNASVATLDQPQHINPSQVGFNVEPVPVTNDAAEVAEEPSTDLPTATTEQLPPSTSPSLKKEQYAQADDVQSSGLDRKHGLSSCQLTGLQFNSSRQHPVVPAFE